ncbi:MAG TPA: DNA-binding protein, partial [Cyanophyceae cyanobacterium]
IVLGIGLAAALAFGVWGLFGESWQKRLAKQTVKYFEKQDVCQKFLKGIDEYWQDTANSFGKGADAVETDWNKYLHHLGDITSPTNESKEHIEEIMKILEVLRVFFAGIPWSNLSSDC